MIDSFFGFSSCDCTFSSSLALLRRYTTAQIPIMLESSTGVDKSVSYSVIDAVDKVGQWLAWSCVQPGTGLAGYFEWRSPWRLCVE